jgi:uncharacterized protein YgiM (DUF1202 family)
MATVSSISTGPGIGFSYGSVSQGEQVLVLEFENGYGYIEYDTGKGKKRGYVPRSSVAQWASIQDDVPFIAGFRSGYRDSTLAASPVFTGPSSRFVKDGSVGVESVTVFYWEMGYVFTEVSTARGPRRGFLPASLFESSPASRVFPTEEDGVGATMSRASSVWAGPLGEYATVGSVAAGEAVRVLARENGYFYIGYDATGKGRKRGFVPSDALNNAATLRSVFPTQTKTGAGSFVPGATTVRYGPSLDYYADGALAAGEGVTVFNGTINGFVEVEYGTAAGTRRGFVSLAELSSERLGSVHVTQATRVFTGPDESYIYFGALSEGELAVVLESEGLYFYVEYNTRGVNGRKRGYVPQSRVPGVWSTAPAGQVLSASPSEAFGLARRGLTVYTGPDDNYEPAGSIASGERVSVLGRSERDQLLIEYNTNATSASKRGFVPASALEVHTSFAPPMPNLSGGGVEEISYGTSPLRHPLKAYRIGRGPRVAVAVFELHGFEDKWNRDGEELVRAGNRLIELAAAERSNLNGFSLYVIPSANPDGLRHGYTNNGPGRCTAMGYDLNRSFPANFARESRLRNYTGADDLLATEARDLYDFIVGLYHQSSIDPVLFDVHGWEAASIGDGEVSAFFRSEFGVGHRSGFGEGYLIGAARALGYRAAILELPPPSSPSDAANRRFHERTANSILSYLRSLPAEPETPEPGTLTLEISGSPETWVSGSTVDVSVACPGAHRIAVSLNSEGGQETREVTGEHGTLRFSLVSTGYHLFSATAYSVTGSGCEPVSRQILVEDRPSYDEPVVIVGGRVVRTVSGSGDTQSLVRGNVKDIVAGMGGKFFCDSTTVRASAPGLADRLYNRPGHTEYPGNNEAVETESCPEVEKIQCLNGDRRCFQVPVSDFVDRGLWFDRTIGGKRYILVPRPNPADGILDPNRGLARWNLAFASGVGASIRFVSGVVSSGVGTDARGRTVSLSTGGGGAVLPGLDWFNVSSSAQLCFTNGDAGTFEGWSTEMDLGFSPTKLTVSLVSGKYTTDRYWHGFCVAGELASKTFKPQPKNLIESLFSVGYFLQNTSVEEIAEPRATRSLLQTLAWPAYESVRALLSEAQKDEVETALGFNFLTDYPALPDEVKRRFIELNGDMLQDFLYGRRLEPASALRFYGQDGGSFGANDWDPTFWKATCPAGAAIRGVSRDTEGRYAHAALCDSGTAGGSPAAVLSGPGDQRRGGRVGDWDWGYYKLECREGEYVSGVSQSTDPNGARIHSVRCSSGAGSTRNCATRVIAGQQDYSGADGDWDSGYYKGDCLPGDVAVGVSIDPESGQAHALLCCPL